MSERRCSACRSGAVGRGDFTTSGAMYRGCQYIWSGPLCEECLGKVLNFEMEIQADRPRDLPPGREPVNPVYELWRHGASDQEIRRFIREELLKAVVPQ